MITPNIEERIVTILDRLKSFRVVKQEFLPTLYTDKVVDKQVLPTDFDGWESFNPPYTLYEQDKYYWFKAKFTIKRENANQKAYFYLDNHIDTSCTASTIRPQGLIYFNGKLTQGIDINHGDVLLEDGEYEAYLLFYTHFFIRYLPMDFSITYTDTRVDSLYYDLEVPYQAMKLLSKTSDEYVTLASAMEKALNLLDLREPYSEAFYASLEKVSAFLKANCYGVTESKATVNCIGHTHIDVAWLWNLDQTKQKIERSFSTVLKLMEEYPEYKFFSSQPQLFDFLKARNPDLYAKVKEKILEGRWEVDGSMWLEADCNLTSGESLVRQIQFGKKFFKEEFGKDCTTVWLPDVFGYSASLPQIMQKSGVDTFVTAKIGWNDTNRMPYDVFKWRGIDGSEVFAYFLSTCECDPRNGVFDQTYTTYTAPITPMYILGTWNRFQQKEFSDTVIMSYGWGDGGGGPTREDVERERRLAQGVPGMPKVQLERLDTSIQAVKESYDKNAAELGRKPIWNGELYFEYHRGTLSSVPQVKMNNRKGEFALMNTELFSVLGGMLYSMEYPSALLEKDWKLLLLNQFHDILPGSSIGDVYKDSEAQFEEIFADSNGVINGVLDTIASKISTKGGLLVCNPNGFTANGSVCVDGITYVAENIPAFGYKVIEKKTAEVSRVKATANTLENSYYQLVFDNSGAICSLVDKRENRQLVKEGRAVNQMVACQDAPYQYHNWEMTPYHKQNQWFLNEDADVTILDEGDRKGLCIVKRYGKSTIRQRVYLYEEGIDRIDFVTDVEWKEKEQLLKTLFPFDLNADKAKYDIQFGHVERATHDNTSWDSARFESAAQKWIDVSENNYGVSILNDGKYGFGVDEGDLSMTLLKSGGFPFEGANDKTPTFIYSILPHKASGVCGGVVEKSYVLNRPFFVREVAEGAGALPEQYGLLACETAGVIVETVKLAEDGEGIIARMYEAYKERKTVRLSIPNAKSVSVCDLNEKEMQALTVDNGVVTFTIKPFEIITLKIRVK